MGFWALCAIFMMFAPVNAEPIPEIYVAFTQVDEQGYYQATVSISNNPGIAAYNLLLEFDSGMLTPISITEGAALQGMVFTSNVTGSDEERLTELNGVTAVWASAENNYGNGVLFTVLFRKDISVIRTNQLNLVSRGIGNADEEIVDFVLHGVINMFDEALEADDGSSGLVVIIIASTVIVVGSVITILVVRNRSRHKFMDNRYHNRGLKDG